MTSRRAWGRPSLGSVPEHADELRGRVAKDRAQEGGGIDEIPTLISISDLHVIVGACRIIDPKEAQNAASVTGGSDGLP